MVSASPSGTITHAFPWRVEETLTSGIEIARPTLNVYITRQDLGITTKALIDTGSPVCIFPRGVGDFLGVDFAGESEGLGIRLYGRKWRSITQTVEMSLVPYDDIHWFANVEFVIDAVTGIDDGQTDLPFAILGVEGFLDQWAMTINARDKYFVVESPTACRERTPPEVFQEMRRRWPVV